MQGLPNVIVRPPSTWIQTNREGHKQISWRQKRELWQENHNFDSVDSTLSEFDDAPEVPRRKTASFVDFSGGLKENPFLVQRYDCLSIPQESITTHDNNNNNMHYLAPSFNENSDGLIFTDRKLNVRDKHKSISTTALNDFKREFDDDSTLSEKIGRAKQKRSASLTPLSESERHDMEIFEKKLTGRKWRSASLIAAQSIIEQDIPLLKNNCCEELAIEAKINIINECQLLTPDPSDTFTNEEMSRRRKKGVCERDKRDRLLVSTTLQYYRRISNWFIWMLDGFNKEEEDDEIN